MFSLAPGRPSHDKVFMISFLTAHSSIVRGRFHLRFGCAVWVCVSQSHAVFYAIFEFLTLKITLKTHATVKRT
jgi:hypothetical protein